MQHQVIFVLSLSDYHKIIKHEIRNSAYKLGIGSVVAIATVEVVIMMAKRKQVTFI